MARSNITTQTFKQIRRVSAVWVVVLANCGLLSMETVFGLHFYLLQIGVRKQELGCEGIPERHRRGFPARYES